MNAAEPAEPAAASRRVRGQVWLITLAALAAVIVVNLFPGRRELSPLDFVVGGQDALQFCDPNHPRFYPSAAERRRAVSLAVTPPAGPAGATRLVIRTASGKTIRRGNLALSEGRLLRLFVVDRTLDRFEEKDPVETEPGVWLFTLQPAAAAGWRIFADFTPRAINRELYAWGEVPSGVPAAPGAPPVPPPEGYRFAFAADPPTLHARQPFLIALSISRSDGGPVLLEPVAGVAGDLVAFTTERDAMAKFECPARGAPPASRPTVLRFACTLDDPGAYVFWADFRLAGRAVYRRFAAPVLP